ncbi:MAG: hypothetical protein OEN01_08785 [Candidatus Krumholzibacteria bacterium]|nr:hypothetical protein [Candidatus Krumholzibacteria bacterium]
MMLNVLVAWIGFLMGCVSGMVTGLFFHGENWLGGYASWPRRMIRLGHLAFWGLAFLNLAFALTARALGLTSGLNVASTLLIVGAITMPLVCYLSAWRSHFRRVFFVPALSVTVAVVLFLLKIIEQ